MGGGAGGAGGVGGLGGAGGVGGLGGGGGVGGAGGASAAGGAAGAGGGGPAPDCNPVLSDTCMPDQGCDTLDNGMTFLCLDMATEALCAKCDEGGGPYCAPTLTCLPSGECARYCCDDGDCGTGKCDKTILMSSKVGVCVK